ncbi:hypothetical protein ABEB36_013561 [Hypothenemus hampei]|uniref:Uncharacterized protein n=1 Tax=Hypothenemus hampei TaxID=57062 RepID=A0ABD1E4V8_HYPHA
MAHLQTETGHALSALGRQLNKLLSANTEEEKKSAALLAEVAQLICNVHHSLSTHRKYNILPFVKNTSRKMVEANKTDEFLLGKNFFQNLKDLELARKTGLELKANLSSNPKPSMVTNSYRPSTHSSQSYNIGNFSGTHSRKYLNFKRQPLNTKMKTKGIINKSVIKAPKQTCREPTTDESIKPNPANKQLCRLIVTIYF